MPFYVSPEQIVKDKADFARKNIARGRNAIGDFGVDEVDADLVKALVVDLVRALYGPF